jgi:hypothetical protein
MPACRRPGADPEPAGGCRVRCARRRAEQVRKWATTAVPSPSAWCITTTTAAITAATNACSADSVGVGSVVSATCQLRSTAVATCQRGAASPPGRSTRWPNLPRGSNRAAAKGGQVRRRSGSSSPVMSRIASPPACAAPPRAPRGGRMRPRGECRPAAARAPAAGLAPRSGRSRPVTAARPLTTAAGPGPPARGLAKPRHHVIGSATREPSWLSVDRSIDSSGTASSRAGNRWNNARRLTDKLIRPNVAPRQ